MCGIIGAVGESEIGKDLLVGLKRLEYRGYDSAGIAIIDDKSQLHRCRVAGHISDLEAKVQSDDLMGKIGIAHTRWATHGKPTEKNAHPHISHNAIAIVHNGIIENNKALREELKNAGEKLTSDTDSELIAHLIYQAIESGDDFRSAIYSTIKKLKGAYAIAVINKEQPECLIAIRKGSPLVVGVGKDRTCLGSDALAISPMVDKLAYLEEGDCAELYVDKIIFYDENNNKVERVMHDSDKHLEAINKNGYDHFMLKEIMEQPNAIQSVLAKRIDNKSVLENIFGDGSSDVFKNVKRIQFVACGTSYHAAMIGKNWSEQVIGLPAKVEIASENRYRDMVIEDGTLFVTLSQSGETADTLAAIRRAKEENYLATLTICNVENSTIVRESDFHLMTHAGAEIGVASTKAFTTQLVGLMLLLLSIGQLKNIIKIDETLALQYLRSLPGLFKQTLLLKNKVNEVAIEIEKHSSAIFLGRGDMYPVALEGALKLKEISYIHAEAFPSGELKHGPLALVDENMPVVALLPNDGLVDKVQSNLQEVIARGGQLIVFADEDLKLESSNNMRVINMPAFDGMFAPFLYVLPMQLLAYYTALHRGTNIDQPRNLAKSVTVE